MTSEKNENTNTTTFYQPEKKYYASRLIEWAKKNPFQATVLLSFGLGVIEYRVHKHLVYSATLKANKKTIDYIASILDRYVAKV